MTVIRKALKHRGVCQFDGSLCEKGAGRLPQIALAARGMPVARLRRRSPATAG